MSFDYLLPHLTTEMMLYIPSQDMFLSSQQENKAMRSPMTMAKTGKTQDRFSELPLSLREYILEHIPIKEAVRTSVLSSKWRYCWNGITSLVFDQAFDDSMPNLTEPELAIIIDRSLALHRGCISKFVLHIPFHVEVANLDIDSWLLTLSRNGIQELAIDCFSDDGDRFTLPSHFFTCLRLTHLSLEGAVLSPPLNFPGFPNLVSLELKGALMCSDVLGGLISGCQLLEKLALAFARPGNHQQPLVFDAFKLMTLVLQESVPGNIILKNVPSLTSVSMMSSECMALEFSDSYCPLRLLGSLSGVKELSFDFQFLEPFAGTCPKILPTKLTNLTSLSLEWLDLWKPEDLQFLFCFIRSSPSLQTLNLRVYADLEDLKDQSLHAEFEDQKNILSNLVTLKIEGCKGIRHEVLLLKIFLARCPNLETLHVELDKQIKYFAAKQMSKALMLLPRLSPKVKLVFSRFS